MWHIGNLPRIGILLVAGGILASKSNSNTKNAMKMLMPGKKVKQTLTTLDFAANIHKI